jgi:hypothetical protein
LFVEVGEDAEQLEEDAEMDVEQIGSCCTTTTSDIGMWQIVVLLHF